MKTMKRALLSVAMVLIAAQMFGQSAGTRGSYSSYYMPMMWGTNGFRTVEEENRLMTENLSELRYQRSLEEASPEEAARLRKKHDEELARRQKADDAKVIASRRNTRSAR